MSVFPSIKRDEQKLKQTRKVILPRRWVSERKQNEVRRQNQQRDVLALENVDTGELSTSSDNSSENEVDPGSYQPYYEKAERENEQTSETTSARKRQKIDCSLSKRCIIDDPQFNAALDRTQTTTRQAMMIVTPALLASGVDVNQLSLSRSSLQRSRNSSREILAAAVRQSFQPTVPLVAHFDGKLLTHLDGTNHDNLAIVVSGLDVEKLLGIPVLPVGNGALMGQKVVEFVHDWKGVEDHLAALCFDTTASNTGIHTGAITVIQKAFDRRLLFLACRHHIFEIYAAAVFDAFFASKGPEIDLFRRFKSEWSFMDKTKFDPLTVDEDGAGCLSGAEQAWLESCCKVVIFQLQQYLNDIHPREDYREFAALALQLLGENAGSMPLRPPGAYHRARWMAKGIYCLKIFGLRHQFRMSKQEMASLRRICLFTCTIYARFWFAAPVGADAPANDLAMLQLLEEYEEVDSKVATAAQRKLRLHLWYLSEDLAALSLFSDNSSDEDKQAIVNALQKDPFPEDRRRVAPQQIAQFCNLSVAHFVTRRSLNLFEALRLSQEFLTTPVDTWSKRDDYIAACKVVHALKVINDCAERAIKLATDFNEVLTKDVQQRQLLYQVVEYHRNLIPTSATKESLSTANAHSSSSTP